MIFANIVMHAKIAEIVKIVEIAKTVCDVKINAIKNL